MGQHGGLGHYARIHRRTQLFRVGRIMLLKLGIIFIWVEEFLTHVFWVEWCCLLHSGFFFDDHNVWWSICLSLSIWNRPPLIQL